MVQGNGEFREGHLRGPNPVDLTQLVVNSSVIPVNRLTFPLKFLEKCRLQPKNEVFSP